MKTYNRMKRNWAEFWAKKHAIALLDTIVAIGRTAETRDEATTAINAVDQLTDVMMTLGLCNGFPSNYRDSDKGPNGVPEEK